MRAATSLKAVKRPAEKSQPLQERPGETLASVVYEQLRRDIIDATHPPGAKLRIQELSERYGLGPSPIREALNRLISDGLVMLSDHKGFSVTPLSAEDLEEVTKTRCWLTEIAVRESFRNGDGDWEDGVQIAYNRLQRIPHSVVQDEKGRIAFNVVWERAHREFHTALIAACGSRRIIDYCEQLFDSADRYRHISRLAGQRPRIDEHKEMVAAALARDAEKAVALLNAHFSKTRELANIKLAKSLSTSAKSGRFPKEVRKKNQ